MFAEICTNQGFNHITENILINLDVKSLWRCRLVCKGLHQFIKSLEQSRKLKKNDFTIIRRLRMRNFLVHSNWNAAFNSICQEDNFYRRRGLIDLLVTYDNQDIILLSYHSYFIDSYLNTGKFLIKRVWCEDCEVIINLWQNTTNKACLPILKSVHCHFCCFKV